MLSKILEPQRQHLFLWVPVMFAVGIAIYFGLSFEPERSLTSSLTGIGVLALVLSRNRTISQRVILLATALICFGFSYAALRTKTVAAPTIPYRYYGPIEGTVVSIDRSASNAVRVTLKDVYLARLGSGNPPEKVRVSMQGFIRENTIYAGARVTLTGSLSPPGVPVEPGGFDFRRMAWFMGLGAVGYTRNPVIPAGIGDTTGAAYQIFQIRLQLSGYIQSKIFGQNGAFAAAILTGDRSGIDPAVLTNLRAANLAHLLAISGLHMGLLSGFVFGLLRYGLALFPLLTLTLKPKKIAAFTAIMAGAGYLALSGANVATQRAFIMTLVVLMAVILDRPAFTLRGVALAALIVLVIKPYSLLEAGFQMSFAATTALISVFEWLRGLQLWQSLNFGRRKHLKPVVALFVTSLVAGLATAPISAFHFNQISHYGLFANLLAVPLMGTIVMPSAVIAAILSIVGLDGVFLSVLGKAVGIILEIAKFFAEIDGALTFVKSTGSFVLGMISVASVIFVLWKGRLKFVSVPIAAVAFLFWVNDTRPDILISEDATLVGVLSDTGRRISKPRGGSYGVNIWLENDGDRVEQSVAAAREGIVQGQDVVTIMKNGWSVVVFKGKDTDIARQLCQVKTILVVSKIESPDGDCIGFDAEYLKSSGAVAIDLGGQSPRITGSRAAAAARPWGQ